MKHDPRDYEIRIRHSPAPGDECFIAQAVEWPEVTAHGDTLEEAAREIHTALELALAAAQEWGHPIPEPKLVHA